MTTISIICMLFVLSLIAGVGEVWVFVLFGVVAFFLVGFIGGMFQGVAEWFGYGNDPRDPTFLAERKRKREIEKQIKKAKKHGFLEDARLLEWQSLPTDMKQDFVNYYRKKRNETNTSINGELDIETPPEEWHPINIFA